MSTIHAGVPIAAAAMGGAAPNLSALGKALGETSISSPDPASPSSLSMAPPPSAASSAASSATKKSPKKRERTDSMKKMTPLPAAQRAKSQGAAYDGGGDDDDEDDALDDDDDDELGDDDEDGEGDGEGDDGYSDASSSTHDASGIKLPVKDRTGSAIAGVSRVTLISNAVKTAPPAKEKSNPRRWSKAEDESLRLAVERSGERNWKAIAEQVPGRNHTQCLQRWTKVLKPGLIKGHWDPEEDAKLRDLVAEGKRNWGQVASLIPGRTSKQCRERWCNHLDPNINKGLYTEDEDRIIMEMQAKLGNRWSIIAQHLKGRTEDAVKIRWKSLMRGKKAAGKELQQQQQQQQSAGVTSISSDLMSAASFAPTASAAPTIQTNTTPQTEDRSRAKPARTPTKQKTRAASPVTKPLEPIAFKPEPTTSMAPAMQQHQQQHPPAPQPIHLPPSSAGITLDGSSGNSIDSNHVAASINSYMQNVNDLVAQSIHNFRLSQNFSPGMQVGPPVSSSAAPPTSTANTVVTSAHMMGSNHPSMMSQSTISPMNQPVYSMPPQQGYHGMPQQHRPYAVPASYQMQAGMSLPPNYVLPNAGMGASAPGQHFPVTMQQSSGHMTMSMGGYGQYSTAMMNDGRGMSMQSQGQGYPPSMGSSVGVTYQNGVPMVSQQYAMPQSLTIPPPHPPVAGSQPEPLAPVSAPPVSLSTASKLATPREEWGSSQTPRSHLIMTEGHASAYELFHQQRLRLMLKERDKGMSLTSAPSPGQAMLTKELKANKERQKRQEMMQQGWKSAVDAMMSLTSDSPSLEDSDNLMEKVVGLSALDPVDDELMGGDVEISLPSDDTIVETDEPILIADNE